MKHKVATGHNPILNTFDLIEALPARIKSWAKSTWADMTYYRTGSKKHEKFLGRMIVAVGLPVTSLFFVQPQLVSPLPDGHVFANTTKVEVDQRDQNYDSWVGYYTDKYFTNPTQRSEVRMIMHCLLHRESKHDTDKGHGDGGRAGGPLQYHQLTWNGYRKMMMDKGLVDEIGSRYDQEQAIETTVWAISTGRAKAWGPILRDMNGSDYATCPTPTFGAIND